MALRTWSTTAANNNSASPNGFPENMAASGLNDSARQVMADVRSWYEDAQWIDFGHAPTRTGNTTFTVATDVTAIYAVGRRLKSTGGSTGYATITASSYSVPDTTITVVNDSGNLPSPLTTVSVGILTASSGAGTGVHYFSDGTVGAPSISFLLDPDTGFYRIGANNIGFSTGGALRFDISATAITSTLPYLSASGTSSAPEYSFSAETGLGFFRSASNVLGVAMAGAKIAQWALGTDGSFQVSSGNANFPSLSFFSDTDTGFYLYGANQIGIALGGTAFGPIASGSWTPTWSGFSAAPGGTIFWTRIGPKVSLYAGTSNTGTSNTTGMSITNVPADIRPATSANSQGMCLVVDNGAEAFGTMSFSAAGATLTFAKGTAPPSSSGFTSSGTKGLPSLCQFGHYSI